MNVLIIGSFPKTEAEIAADAAVSELFNKFKESCHQLGKKLAEQKFKIFVGSDRVVDADTYIVEGANKAEGKKKTVVVYVPTDWPFTPFVTRWESLPNIDPEYRRVPGIWQHATIHIIRKVDVVIVIGGRMATLQAGMAAPALSKPTIAVTAFGGEAVKVFEAFEKTYAASHMSGAALNALQNSFDTPEAADKIVQAIEHIRKTNTFRVPTGLGARVSLLLVVLTLIIFWAFVLVRGSDRSQPKTESSNLEKKEELTSDDVTKIEEPKKQTPAKENKTHPKLTGTSDEAARQPTAPPDQQGPQKSEPKSEPREPSTDQGSKSTNSTNEKSDDKSKKAAKKIGTEQGESVGRPFQTQDIGESTFYLIFILMLSATIGSTLRAGLQLLQDQVLKTEDVINELIVGLLLSFSLLIVYLTMGMLYPGDSLEVTPGNFRRTAVTVSAIALAAAFLLETAATEVRRRLGQTIQR